MIFVSHDRYFIDRFATRIWQVQDGKIIDFLGGYKEFKEQRERQLQSEAAMREREKKAAKAEKTDKPAREDKHKSENVRSREAEKRRKERQRKITALEKQLEELETQMADCPAEDYVRLGDLFNQKEAVEEELLLLYEEEEG